MKFSNHCIHNQDNLDKLETREQTGKMSFHPENCYVLKRKREPTLNMYVIHVHELQYVTSAKYLGAFV